MFRVYTVVGVPDPHVISSVLINGNHKYVQLSRAIILTLFVLKGSPRDSIVFWKGTCTWPIHLDIVR